MSVPQQSPALPWGSGQQAAQDKQEPSVVADDVHAVSIDQLGLTIGDRIEVKWQVQPDEGDPIERWWGASITAAEPTASSGTPAYSIRYDTWPECDFNEEEQAEVALLNTHRLLDLRQQEVMAWRREGDGYEPADTDSEEEEEGEGIAADDEDEALAEGAEGRSFTVAELAAGISDADVSAEEARLAAAPQHVAAGYKEFMDNLKQYILAKASQAQGEGGGELLITAADVADFKAMMMTQAAAGRGRVHRAA
uniref:Uncharacterized protein n=1 Tax=Tetradesmus obliquus TaxID=3088 RepID=A0A383WDR3_TETOB|eukprot:jgi/Sobl393_1/15276/SZX75144.1